MKARKIEITYKINGETKTAQHSNKTVAQAVRTISSALREIDKEDGWVIRSRILKVEAEY